MVDEATRYYIRKQNLEISDDFHEYVAPSDTDILTKAGSYMVVAPIVTTAIIFGFNKIRESGGASSHVAHAIKRAKGRFTPNSMSGGQKWSSKNRKNMTQAELDLDTQTDAEKSSDSLANVYKQMKEDRKSELEERLRSGKEQA